VCFTAFPFLGAGQYLVGGELVNAVLGSKFLDGLALGLEPFLGLCWGSGGGHHSKPFKRVQLSKEYHSNEWCQQGVYIQMSGIGDRLREERERLGLSQGVFGEIGGVKANAQGNYEKGERNPDAGYLAAIAARGVDVLYVVTGERRPTSSESLNEEEARLIAEFRSLPDEDRASVARLTLALSLTKSTTE